MEQINISANDVDEACIELYELSKHPSFPRVLALVNQVALDSAAPRPRSGKETTAWNTYTITRDAIEDALSRVVNAVARGELLSKDTGEKQDGRKETGHREPRPRA